MILLIYSTIGCESDESGVKNHKIDKEVFVLSESSPDIVNDVKEFRHPFKSGYTTKGIVLSEVKDDEQGRRYIVGEEQTVDEYGNISYFSGVKTIETGNSIETEDTANPQTETRSAPVVSNDVADLVDNSKSDDATLLISISLEKPSYYRPIIYKIEESLALGEIDTEDDYKRVRRELTYIQQDQVKTVFNPLSQYVRSIGGVVVSQPHNLFRMTAVLKLNQVYNLSYQPEVARIDKFYDISDNYLDGISVAQGTQMETSPISSNDIQFIDDLYTGQKSTGYANPLIAGVIEHKYLYEEHHGFLDWHNSPSRITHMFNCYNYYCHSVTSFPSPTSNHGTVVTGIFAGDITGEQSVYFDDEARRRSGYAREAQIYYFRAKYDSQIATAFDKIIDYPCVFILLT